MAGEKFFLPLLAQTPTNMEIAICIMGVAMVAMFFFCLYILSELREHQKVNKWGHDSIHSDISNLYNKFRKSSETQSEDMVKMLGGSVHKCYDDCGELASVRVEAPWLNAEICRQRGSLCSWIHAESVCRDAIMALGHKVGHLKTSAKNPPTKKKP